LPYEELCRLRFFDGSDLGLQILQNIPEFYDGTSPNKFFDYIAAGLPVLANYPGWVADMIEDGEFGFCATPECSSEITQALINASESKNQLREMGAHARTYARDNFDRDRLTAGWIGFVEDHEFVSRGDI